MNKQAIIIICALLQVTATQTAEFCKPRSPMIFEGKIQFPRSIKKTPDIRIYRGGSIIDTETNALAKQISYSITDDRSQNMFTLLIADFDALRAELDENTVKYFKIKPHNPYKFYSLMLKEIVTENQTLLRANQTPQSHFIWVVKQHTLPFNGRIPDNAIRVCYNPEFIAGIQGGNQVNLPSIIIKPDIVNIAGSEAELNERSIETLLAFLDHDALHSHTKQTVKLDYANKTVITLTT